VQITETRACEQVSFTASVSAKELSAEHPLLRRLAASRAWLQVTEQLASEERWGESLGCGKRAVEELGTEYRDYRGGVRDDTPLKLSAAEEQEAAGNVGAAARVTRKVLVARVAMLEKLLEDQLAE